MNKHHTATRIAEALERIESHLAALVEQRGRPNPNRTRSEKVTQAIAAIATIGPNVAAIARHVGVPRNSLYNWPEFRDALSRFSGGSARAPRRGRKVRGRGSDVPDMIEAWDGGAY